MLQNGCICRTAMQREFTAMHVTQPITVTSEVQLVCGSQQQQNCYRRIVVLSFLHCNKHKERHPRTRTHQQIYTETTDIYRNMTKCRPTATDKVGRGLLKTCKAVWEIFLLLLDILPFCRSTCKPLYYIFNFTRSNTKAEKPLPTNNEQN